MGLSWFSRPQRVYCRSPCYCWLCRWSIHYVSWNRIVIFHKRMNLPCPTYGADGPFGSIHFLRVFKAACGVDSLCQVSKSVSVTLENTGRMACGSLWDTIHPPIRWVDERAHTTITITMKAVERRKHQMLFDRSKQKNDHEHDEDYLQSG